jgi:hypothetical protein
MAAAHVDLECVKVGGKLRVRILTYGYLRDANCQFPRDLRVEGRLFRVKPSAITLITSAGKWFYSVKQRDQIEIVGSTDTVTGAPNLTVYEDSESPDCVICFSEPKDSVMYPCGHFYLCDGCAHRVGTCPICRAPITKVISRSQIG